MDKEVSTETAHFDHDFYIKKRIAKWIKDRWDAGDDFGDTSVLLLDFYNYLNVCEEERTKE